MVLQTARPLVPQLFLVAKLVDRRGTSSSTSKWELKRTLPQEANEGQKGYLGQPDYTTDSASCLGSTDAKSPLTPSQTPERPQKPPLAELGGFSFAGQRGTTQQRSRAKVIYE